MGPQLSDLELMYPFAPRSREFFDAVTVEERLASGDVVDQAETRLMNALGRVRYEPSMVKDVEFSGFFAAALVASQDPVLTSKFSKKEAERAREYFAAETSPKAKTVALSECFGATVSWNLVDGRSRFAIPFEGYLMLVARYELGRLPKWKLARQGLDRGIVRMTDNMINDFFGDCAQAAIGAGVKNLRRGQLPRQLQGVKTRVLQYVPTPRPRAGKGYEYVEELLKHPVSDGRHRMVWLVLAPYLVNVKKVDDEVAIEKIREFVSVAGETRDLKRFVEYNVKRARRNGLLPPTYSTLKQEHPDVYGLLPKEVVNSQLVQGAKGTAKAS
ncbi:MAG TPA: DNA primase noncatalytic subunit PriX [Nitrososphaerales archaeon]|nr:DNA primase noncatalytic subunit PriX [Nitrososphaerales archaeon]